MISNKQSTSLCHPSSGRTIVLFLNVGMMQKYQSITSNRTRFPEPPAEHLIEKRLQDFY
jgi:hypothetical protein